MWHRILGLEPSRTLIAAKSTLAIVIGYGLGLGFDWKASSIATTIIVLQTASLGTTLKKASLRMTGTLSGALVGVVIVATCAHDRELFILAMAVVAAVCVWGMQSSSHQYAWMLVMLTCAIVGWPTAMNPANTFHTCVDRVTAVTVGVVLSSLVHGVFWPVTAGQNFERSMQEVVEGCRDLVLLIRRGLLNQDIDVQAIDKMEIKLISLSTSISATLNAARVDSEHIRRHYRQYEQLGDALEELVLATTAIGGTATLYRKVLMVPAVSYSASLQQMLDTLDDVCSATVQQLAMPRDGSHYQDETKAASILELQDQTLAGSQGTVAFRLLLNSMLTFQEAALRVRSAIAKAEVSSAEAKAASTIPQTGPDTKTRFAKSALAGLQVVASAWFFVLLNWPLGLQSAMILTMIFVYLNAQLPVALTASTILQAVLMTLPIAAVFHFIVMPTLDSFIELSPWLAFLFFPLMYGLSSQNPLKSMSAMLTVNLTNSLISVSTTPPQYDFSSFANTYLGMSGGVAIVLLLAYLFETRSPRRGLHGALTALLKQSADYLKALEDDSPGPTAEPTLAKKHRMQWMQRLGQLKKLSAAVDYRQDPQANRDQVSTMLQSCDVLVARLFWSSVLSVPPRREARIEKRPLNREHDWCAATIAATVQSLGALQPIDIQQPDKTLFRDGEFMMNAGQSADVYEPSLETEDMTRAKSTYYRALAEAIMDCQREINRVDWKRWTQSYF
ncbi:p-hydroxybenzoic acid efflux pump subunit AaeB [Symmachiella dynata]|uniref:FUSC family protein n=1 Tax=Symmachiella dynata TaxID=2527995 RepID=UPI00118B125A|nr:FUSC family protein [Symmachiella dynata]QDT48960.1 p-hydroxybenzoic acid efflux pump subunit AaeB [Symmachiella dynata]